MTEQLNNPRDWVFRINERQQVTFGELAQILGGYGFAITDVVTNQRVQKTFVIRSEKRAERDRTTEEVIAERFEGLDRRIGSIGTDLSRRVTALEAGFANHTVSPRHVEMLEKKIEANRIDTGNSFDDLIVKELRPLSRASQRLSARLAVTESYIQAAETCVHVTPDEAKRLEARLLALETRAGLRNDNKPRDLSDEREDGTGIKVVIHDFDYTVPLGRIAEALRCLNPTRVLVDTAGVGKQAAETLRTQWGLPVEPLPKRTKPTPLPPEECVPGSWCACGRSPCKLAASYDGTGQRRI